MRASVDHEAAHVTAAVLAGLRVLTARVFPDGSGVAYVLPGRGWRLNMVATLMGHIQDGIPDWPPRGLDFKPWSKDGEELLAMADRHNIAHDDYRTVVDAAWDVFRSDDYRRIHPLIAAVLERDSSIDKPDIDRIAKEVMQ